MLQPEQPVGLLWEYVYCACKKLGSSIILFSDRKQNNPENIGGVTLCSSVSMLYHMTEAQPLGNWQLLEMTTKGKEQVCGGV